MLFVFAVYSALAEEYAHIYIHNNSTATDTTAGSWSKVTAFSQGTVSTNWTFNGTTDQLGPSSSGTGTYYVRYSLSFIGEPGTWDAGISINDAAPNDLLIQRTVSSASDIGNVSASGIITISSTTDSISLKVKGPGSGAISYTAQQAQITITKMESNNSGNYFAEMSIYNNGSSQSLDIAFATITNFAAGNLSGDATNGWTFATNTLTAHGSAAGTYLAIYAASYDGASNTDFQVGVSKNDANPDQIIFERSTTSNDMGNSVCTGIISVVDGDAITIRGSASSNNRNCTFEYSNLVLIQLSGTTSIPYAEMLIDSGTTALALTQDTWTKISGLAGGTIESGSWNFQTNALKPISLSAGIYMVNYYVSAGYGGSESNLIFEMGGFKGETEQNNLTVSRKLFQNSGDVGAASGTGIITIDIPEDTLTLRLKNTTNNEDIIPIYSNMSLFRLQLNGDGSLPVELVSFSGTAAEDKILLDWSTASEINNLGFKVLRSINKENDYKEISSYVDNVNLIGAGNSSSGLDYQFIDYGVQEGNTYWYQLLDVDYSGLEVKHEPIKVEFHTQAGIPLNATLFQNYPNPFNPATTIEYHLKKESNVQLTIYDISGRLLKILVNQTQDAGQYNFSYNAADLPSGIYFYKLKAGSFEQIRKMTLLK